MNALINDEQSLRGAAHQRGHKIPTYDDGYGPLWIHRDSLGITGIVRAQTWEDAYGICEDEFFPDADEEADEERARIDAMPEGEERNHAQACWDEAYGYRSSGRRTLDACSYIYAKDLNGDSLDRLTDELVTGLGITLEIVDND